MDIEDLHSLSRNAEDTINLLSALCHQNSEDKGFWDSPQPPNIPEKLALIHAEVSEALESLRTEEEPSKKIPSHTLFAEELADIVIRVMDLAVYKNVNLGQAITDKMRYNINRPRMHGKKF